MDVIYHPVFPVDVTCISCNDTSCVWKQRSRRLNAIIYENVHEMIMAIFDQHQLDVFIRITRKILMPVPDADTIIRGKTHVDKG